jgi:hypothetical protein
MSRGVLKHGSFHTWSGKDPTFRASGAQQFHYLIGTSDQASSHKGYNPNAPWRLKQLSGIVHVNRAELGKSLNLVLAHTDPSSPGNVIASSAVALPLATVQRLAGSIFQPGIHPPGREYFLFLVGDAGTYSVGNIWVFVEFWRYD